MSQIKKQVDLSNFFEMGKGNLDDEMIQESYRRLEERAKYDLSMQLINLKRARALEGVEKSKIDKFNKLDVITNDIGLIQSYLIILMEMGFIE
ncbi:hypothetical protein M5W70_16245 [Paenibacillus larvae]|uniref:Uncharacterized protein n=1 Tax=Paenibacillus larvae TaxID=1464 RepID=A0AAP5N0Q7_9BACL|nr:hypothetical protein [Paenibacillus larvae]MCY9690201.1 hypothetical protein [Paenibacillus larvae]MDT2252766.1 hypothetical protein [Paenibacillus larvae]MDT2277376.1 hypothetical protein [Paenibacillus larvae]MDT2305748.1 hypothetical protein [Paenibacillus larvae]MDV3485613.1 hypothetical protein [Paenibacillus larvae]